MNRVFLDSDALAERWGIRPQTIRAWRVRGCGPPYMKAGRKVLYRLSDIEEYEAARTRDPEGDR